ncbi:rhamnosyl transferase WbbL2 [Rhodococcus wratislaviensis IFP 2016]|nr:rhamnosyl transferase WbbL2 [Rhodococcus wratislaviensis IFP 2016]
MAVPVYGQVAYTHALVADLSAQGRDADFVIIDNKGDYVRIADERVVTPGRNLGWAEGSNLGFRLAFSEGYEYAMTLNNDTRLSPQFFDGLLDSRLPEDAGVIVPAYDDVNPHQKSAYTGPAASYEPIDIYRKAPFVDGTALVITRDAWVRAGGLDARTFGKFAWGADMDLCFRVGRAGFGVYVTERSYINHLGQKTARANRSRLSYEGQSWLAWARGIRRTYGQREWSTLAKVPVTKHSLVDHSAVE